MIEYCRKCGRRNVVSSQKLRTRLSFSTREGGIPYAFVNFGAQNWSEGPPPRNLYKRRR